MKTNIHNPDAPIPGKSLSLSRRGAWGQVTIAAILITILPALIMLWVWMGHLNDATPPPVAIWCAGGVIVLVITLGYTLLLKYPVSIVRLRHYLSTLAGGGIPDQIVLTEDEDDLAAVQHYMERIVNMAEDRIRMLEKRHEVELESERQRVMIESIGAMCHHVGQPATVISMCLHLLKNNPSAQDAPRILAECEAAFDSMTAILDQLRATSHYSSEAYLQPSASSNGSPAKPGARIIKM